MLLVRTAAFREFVRLMLPRMLSYPIDPILLSYFAVLALSFGEGSASALTFADDYRVVPVILIAQQFSLAVFPSLSAAHAARDRGAFRAILSRNVLADRRADDDRRDRAGDPRAAPDRDPAARRRVRRRRTSSRRP